MRTAALALLTFGLATLLFVPFFGDLLFDPNEHTPTFGGDGLTIHYNLQYHALHGEGAWLESQYTPNRESIFMTDAQGVVAVVLAELRPWFPGLGAYAVGISNALIYWSNALAAVVLLLLLLKLRIRPLLAVSFAVLIAAMSPQIIRQFSGHYALGYAFLLPTLCWYLLSDPARGDRLTLRTVMMVPLIVLLGLNNPYLMLISASFLLACVGVGIIWARARVQVGWRRLGHWLGLAVASILIVFLTLSAFDEVDDRVTVPYGFFHNITTKEGLLVNPGTFAYEPMMWLMGSTKVAKESMAYLGLVPLLAFLVYGGYRLFTRRLRTGAPAPTSYGPDADQRMVLWTAFWAAILCLLFAFALPFRWFVDFSYAHLGPILQFRAPGRFTWPLYYVVGIGASVLIGGQFERWWRGQRRGLAIGLAVLAGGLWIIEAMQYLEEETVVYHNAFAPEQLEEMGALAGALGVDTAQYQGIYLLPTEIQWTDKVHITGRWRSNYDGYQTSLTTGLPLVNGKLSRMSVDHSMAALQLVSDPTFERELLDRLDPTRDILLLASREDSLKAGEKHLLGLGALLHRDEVRELRRVSVAELRAGTGKNYAGPVPRVVRSLAEDAMTFPNGTSEVIDVPLDSALLERPLELEFWVEIDKELYGGPFFNLYVRGADGGKLFHERVWTNESYDVRDGWLRLRIPFEAPAGAERLEVVADHHGSYVVRGMRLIE